ncbi:MAG: Fe-S cluster assembly protein SufD [Bacteroidaceae bacterium]|nr:Fe-S cluster assembly protein SufD [Bacteroidaceae bacterium]
MSCEQEYITLFEQNRELLDTPCAAMLNNERDCAFAKFKTAGLPGIKDENWLHTNVAKRFATNYGMNLGRVATGTNVQEIFTCDVPNLKTHRAYIVNDSFMQDNSSASTLPHGVILDSLNKVAKEQPGLLEPYYNKLAKDGDSIVQFNTSFVQDGIVLYIPADTTVTETIQIVSLLQAKVEFLSNRRLLVILDKGSKASLLLCDHSSQELQSLSTQVMEIFIAQGAALELYELEETSNSNTRLGNLYVKQAANSSFNHCNITLTNGFTRNYTNVSLEEAGAEANLHGLVIGDRQQHTDNRTLVDHKAAHCTSSETYKYILDDDSKGVFAGRMLIRQGAQHTVSQQTNRNLCLTSCAQMYAQPQLEIYADDVKCSHGSTVGQLDENALFYMQQRGIPADEARHLLMYAFAGEVIESIKLEELRDRLHILVEKRFRGELNHCKKCNLCK